jgi:hypothetical protein
MFLLPDLTESMFETYRSLPSPAPGLKVGANKCKVRSKRTQDLTLSAVSPL